ncbi:MAG: OadG family protein [Clostridiales bacterium]|jgi:Na+-transporting methylmalonyl-CoA/oxaloacetate decarboxylase gamma subunit|nr:OadG family protein [Clostridiales bacterium]
MLTGQAIGVFDALIIAVAGMSVVMLALGILAGFVYGMGRILHKEESKEDA